jgi:hypothetical protein
VLPADYCALDLIEQKRPKISRAKHRHFEHYLQYFRQIGSAFNLRGLGCCEQGLLHAQDGIPRGAPRAISRRWTGRPLDTYVCLSKGSV